MINQSNIEEILRYREEVRSFPDERLIELYELLHKNRDVPLSLVESSKRLYIADELVSRLGSMEFLHKLQKFLKTNK